MVAASDVHRVLLEAVEVGVVPGIVALAADTAGNVYEGAFGTREIGGTVPMTLDTVMWIASMTKAVTSVAALQLVEQGRIDLDEPLSERVPELAAPQVLDIDVFQASPRSVSSACAATTELRRTRKPCASGRSGWSRCLPRQSCGMAYVVSGGEAWKTSISRAY